jgi:hypothetical protein
VPILISRRLLELCLPRAGLPADVAALWPAIGHAPRSRRVVPGLRAPASELLVFVPGASWLRPVRLGLSGRARGASLRASRLLAAPERTGRLPGAPLRFFVAESIWSYISSDGVLRSARQPAAAMLPARTCLHG